MILKGDYWKGYDVSRVKIEISNINEDSVFALIETYTSTIGMLIPIKDIILGKFKLNEGIVEIEKDERFEKLRKKLLRKLGG